MKLPFRYLVLSAVISVLTLQLSGCGEGSNNLVDPVAEQQTNTITSCDAAKELCTSGQFIDEPVSGLNYACNQVKGITDKDGIFSCPNNSVVTFYLQAEKGKHKITFGSYLIKSIGNVTGVRQETLLQVTPKDLVTGDYTNILRLLQAMDSDGHNSQNNISNRIVITDVDKSHIDLIGRDLTSLDLTNDGALFAQTVSPLTVKLGRSLPSSDSATVRFEKSLMVLQSGVYEVSPFIVGIANISGNKFYTGMVGETTLSNQKAFEGLFFLIDRDTKLIGTGLEWNTNLNLAESDNALLQNVLFTNQPKDLRFVSSDTGFDTAGKIKPNFKLIAENQDEIEITQGVMTKGNLLGNDFFYRNVYGLTSLDVVNQTDLGKWRRSGTLNLTGSVTISKTRNISPFLDPSIWKTKDNDLKPIFPLHLKLTLLDNDFTSCKNTGCTVGSMGISILDNGNIISDRNNNCRTVDSDMVELLDANTPTDLLLQEHRLGVVSATLQDAKVGASISPIILVDNWAKSDLEWSKFFGVFMGMQSGVAGGPRVQINLANVLNKVVSIQNQQDEKDTTPSTMAKWSNYNKLLKAYSKSADTRDLAINQAQGIISKIEVQDCNTFLK